MARTLAAVPTATGLGQRNGAAVLDAVQAALQLYLHLKSQEEDDKQKWAQINNTRTNSAALNDYYKVQAENLKNDNTRADKAQNIGVAKDIIDKYPGATFDAGDPTINQIQDAGYGAALNKQMTLPAERLPGMNVMPPANAGEPMPVSPVPQTMSPAPQAETGKMQIAPTESEKMRIAMENNRTRESEGEANRAQRTGNQEANRGVRESIARMTSADKHAALLQSKWYQNASLALRQSGQNIDQHRLELALLAHDNSVTQEEFADQMKLYTAATKGGTDLASILRMADAANQPLSKPEMPKAPTLKRPQAGVQPAPAPGPAAAPTPQATPPAGSAARKFTIVQEP